MGLTLYDERVAITANVAFAAGDTTTPKLINTGAGSGTVVNQIYIASTSASDHDVLIGYGATLAGILACVKVPAGAGHSSAVAIVEVVSAMVGSPGAILVPSGSTLYMGLVAALTGAETMQVATVTGVL
jgi:hypothetical protein